MKIKRKMLVLSAIVLRVLELRFKEIVSVQVLSESMYEVSVICGIDVDVFMPEFDRYMVHLIDEFGAPDGCYMFRFFQDSKCRGELRYAEGNNEAELTVNEYSKQRYGN
jgi:hypothetical protein